MRLSGSKFHEDKPPFRLGAFWGIQSGRLLDNFMSSGVRIVSHTDTKAWSEVEVERSDEHDEVQNGLRGFVTKERTPRRASFPISFPISLVGDEVFARKAPGEEVDTWSTTTKGNAASGKLSPTNRF